MKSYVIAALIGWSIFSQWQLGNAKDLAESNRVARDSIAAEALVDAFATDSTWEVRFATQADDLAGQLEQGPDTARARLATELGAANVRIGLLQEVVASARGEVVSVGNRVGALADSLSTTIETCSGAWEGDIADGLLTASWGFLLPAIEHTLDYSVKIPGELIVAEAGDGRTIVSAKSNHPNATLELGELTVDPPDPVVEVKLSWKQAFVALVLGAFGWEVAR